MIGAIQSEAGEKWDEIKTTVKGWFKFRNAKEKAKELVEHASDELDFDVK